MLTVRTKTIERTGTGRQFPPFLASLSATKFSLQIYKELTARSAVPGVNPGRGFRFSIYVHPDNAILYSSVA